MITSGRPVLLVLLREATEDAEVQEHFKGKSA
jgi:hypothetical protein